MRLIIGVPCQDDVKAAFAFDLITMTTSLVKSLPDLQLGVVAEQGCSVFMQRNRLAAQALAHQADYLLMIDSDMRFPPHTFTTLLKAEKPIIACPAIQRKPPFKVNYEGMEAPQAKISKVKRIGTGVMLISTQVFKNLEMPWFAQPWREEKGFLGSDYYFCDKAQEAGYPVYAHNGLKIGHTGIRDYYEPKWDQPSESQTE